MFGSFNDFTTSDSGGLGSGTSPGNRQRSRSRGSTQQTQSRPAAVLQFKEPWTTDHAGLDEYVKKHNFEQQTLDKLTSVEVKHRRRWVSDVMSKGITDPNAWIGKCYNNYVEERKLEQVTGMNRFGEQVSQRRTSGGSSPGGQIRSNFAGSIASGPPASSWNTGMPGVGRPPTDSRTCGGGEALGWAKEIFQMWPHEMSKMVRELCKHLNNEAMDVVMSLDGPTAAAICVTLLFAAPADDDGASALIKQWGERRAAFMVTVPSTSAEQSQASSTSKEMEIMIVVVGINDGRAALLAHAAAKMMQQHHGDKIRFEKPIIIAPTVIKDIKSLQETCGLTPSRPDITTLAELESFIERSSTEWGTRKTKFLLISVLTPSAEFQKTQNQGDSSDGLHITATRWIFEAGAIADTLCTAVGNENVASILFAPTWLNSGTTSTLKVMFGEMMEDIKPCANTVSNTPLVFTVPSGSVYQAVIQETDKMMEQDGWKMKAKVYDWATKNHSLGTQAIDLAMKKLFKERDWTPAETELMESLTAQHTQSGEHRYLNREWWMQQYGILGQTPLPSFYKSRLPCHGETYAITGLPGKGAAVVPCGKARYCENCERLILQLDQGYNFPMMANAVINILTKAVGFWKRGGDIAAFARVDGWDRRHTCGPGCVHNPNQL